MLSASFVVRCEDFVSREGREVSEGETISFDLAAFAVFARNDLAAASAALGFAAHLSFWPAPDRTLRSSGRE